LASLGEVAAIGGREGLADSGRRRPARVRVAHVCIERPLQPLTLGPACSHALLVVRLDDLALGEVLVPARGSLSAHAQATAITAALGDGIWRERLRRAFLRAARSGTDTHSEASSPDVSVVVCATGDGNGLAALLDSLKGLLPGPAEVIVVGSPPTTRGRELSVTRGIRYVEEPGGGLARARNRGIAEASGELVAFVDEGSLVDRRWLDGLSTAFADPLVFAVAGYVGPAEVETSLECLREWLFPSIRPPARRTYDAFASSRLDTREGNLIVRRGALERVGAFAECLGPGTPALGGHERELCERVVAAGYRVAFDPGRIVWEEPPHNRAELRRDLRARTVGRVACATHRLGPGRDARGLRLAADWWVRELPREVALTLRRDPRRLPPRVLAAQIIGSLGAPARLIRSRRRQRTAPQLDVAEPPRPTPTVHVRTVDGPRLSVAIASYNRRKRLAKVLTSLAEQTYPPDRYEVVVVLDGSTDGSVELARCLDVPYPLRLFEQDNCGLAASRNRGAREADAPVVVFLDDDIVPEEAFLAEHAAAHHTGEAEVVLGSCPPANPDVDHVSLALRHWWTDYFRRRAQPDHQWSYTDFGDGNVSMPRSLVLESGGWDEQFAHETVRRQDWEYAIRLLQRGTRFIDRAAARGWHHYEIDFVTALRNKRVEGRSDILLARKHPAVKPHLFLAGFVPDALRRGPSGFHATYRLPAVTERGIRGLIGPTRALERAGVHRFSWRLTLKLLAYSYLLGVRDELPTPERFREFVAPIVSREAVETVPVELDRPGAIELAPAIGGVDLALSYEGRALARVEAMRPETQWDWEALTERVVESALDPYRQVLSVGNEDGLGTPLPTPLHR
jgi:glycosyltransferase involved in cell wall biosynthesis